MAARVVMKTSDILDWVEEYLAFRRQHGYGLKWAECYLRSFARYAEEKRHSGPITLDLAVEWALRSRSTNPAQAACRLAVIRPFAQYRALIDPKTEIPPVGFLGRKHRRKPPHIYSKEEIRDILQLAAKMTPRGALSPKTYVTFLSLLFSTGLRVSEACNLMCSDVDLREGVLTVRKAKYGKTRLLPLHPSANKALAQYARYRDAVTRKDTAGHFFRTERVPRLTIDAVDKAFSRMRVRLGWTANGRARRPRLHDARHTFAVRRLQRWYEDGVDVGTKILSLSTYLGHAQVSDTYWYLTGVPELMSIASRRFEKSKRTKDVKS